MPESLKMLILTISTLGVMLLFSLSVMIWGIVLMRLRRGKPIDLPDFCPDCPQPDSVSEGTETASPVDSERVSPGEVPSRPDSQPHRRGRVLPPLGGMIPPALLTFLWLGIAFMAMYGGDESLTPEKLTHQQIFFSLISTAVESVLVIGMMTGLLLMFALGHRELPVRHLLGFSTSRPGEHLLVGGIGFIAVLLPVYAVIFASLPLRSDQTLHPFLQIARDSPPFAELALITLTAVILAPLKEELLFRVVLQPFFEHFLPAPVAITVVAVLFAAVHQFPDSLSILPLGLILGYLFYKTRSYLVVVTVHSLFNGFNLAYLLLHTVVFRETGVAG